MTRRRLARPEGMQTSIHGQGVSLAMDAQIEALRHMTLDQLRETWTRSFGEAPPGQGKDLVLKRLAWQLQARSLGGLSPDMRRRIQRLHDAFERDPRYTPSPTLDLPPGAVLTREWRGALHRVQVLEDGFAYDGKRFDSLSEIARRITGTCWSGPQFFGLKTQTDKP